MNTIRGFTVKLALSAALVVLLAGLGASPALADTCGGTIVGLTVNNVGLGASVDFCVTTVSGNTNWTLWGTTGDTSNSGPLVFINQFDWNGTATFDAATSSSGWSLVTNNGASDGFGKFDNEVTNPGNTQGIGTIIEFSGAGPTEVAVHAGFQNCTGWFTNAAGEQTTTGGGNCGGEPVPEPATLTLLGTGLVMLGGKIRRRLRKK